MISRASAELRGAATEPLRAAPPIEMCSAIPAAETRSIIEPCIAADEASAAAHVRKAFEQKRAIYPTGGETSLDFGLPRTKPGVALSLAALDRIMDYPADDLTVSVEAGITLAALNKRLAEKRQWLPIDAPEAEKATLGGIIATNACGPRRQGYGTIGDYLLGFRAIDGRGEIFAGGGKVVKNAAGYNLPRLMVGSLGTLGLITEATFMVRPLPACAALVIYDLPRFEPVEDFLAGLGRSKASPAIVELLAGPARPNCPLPAMPASAAARLVLGFEGSAIEVRAMQGTICDEWKSAGIGGVTTIAGSGVSSIFDWLGASPAIAQINVLPSRVASLVEQFAKLLPAYPMQAHAASGVIRVYPIVDRKGGIADSFVKLIGTKLRSLATAAGGYLTLLHSPDNVQLATTDIWGPPRAGAALMRAIQQRFDPAGILNPGRFPFGSA